MTYSKYILTVARRVLAEELRNVKDNLSTVIPTLVLYDVFYIGYYMCRPREGAQDLPEM